MKLASIFRRLSSPPGPASDRRQGATSPTGIKRIALVGTGVHSRSCHVPAITAYAAGRSGAVELAAVCTRTIAKAEVFRTEFGFTKAYAGIREMLAQERLDACICVVPADQVATTSIELLRQRIPVLMEKPIALTTRELESVLATARETGTRHMVSLNRRHNPCLTSAVSWCQKIGPIRLIEARMMRRARRERTFLLETGIHALDVALGVGGRVRRLQIDEQRGDRGDSAWHLIDVEFSSGCRARVEILPTAGIHAETYDLHGTGFLASCALSGDTGPSAVLWSGDTTQTVEYPNLEGRPDIDGSFEETTAFLDAVLQDRDVHPTVFDVEESTRRLLQVAAR